MSEEKRTPPEIDHGPPIDHGADRDHHPKPCSKRMQGAHGVHWCTLPIGHAGECIGSELAAPLGANLYRPPGWAR